MKRHSDVSADFNTNVEYESVRMPEGISSAYEAACGLIAPTWPLDQMIAVNPFWELRDRSFASVAAGLSALARCRTLMPPAHYATLKSPHVTDRHLLLAAEELGISRPVESLQAELIEAPSPTHWHNISDFLYSALYRQHKIAWSDEITHQISQFLLRETGLFANLLALIRGWEVWHRFDTECVHGAPTPHRFWLPSRERDSRLGATIATDA